MTPHMDAQAARKANNEIVAITVIQSPLNISRMVRGIGQETGLLASTILENSLVRQISLGLFSAIFTLITAYAIAGVFSDTPLGTQVLYSIGLGRDRSMSEIVNYGLAFSAALLFLLASMEHRSRALLFLAVLMLFVWFDDSANYHEKVGNWIASAFTLPLLPNSREQDTAELLAWACAGVPLGLGLLVSLHRRDRGDLGVLGLVGVFFSLLVAFGVVVDAFHRMGGPDMYQFFVVIEDGGEMLAITGILCVAIGLNRAGTTYFERASNLP